MFKEDEIKLTHAITSAEGPSRAGPISDRVVNPDALSYCKMLLVLFSNSKHTLDQDQRRRTPGLAWTKRPTYSLYLTPSLERFADVDGVKEKEVVTQVVT